MSLMNKNLEDREFILSYQGAIKDEPLICIAKMANLDGLKGKEIAAVETVVEFGVGIKVKFIYKQPIPGMPT